jgi:hypothetical protein
MRHSLDTGTFILKNGEENQEGLAVEIAILSTPCFKALCEMGNIL